MEHFRAKEVVQVWSAQFRHYFDVTLGFEQMYFVFISSAILIFCKWYSGNRADESRKVAKFGQLFWAKVVGARWNSGRRIANSWLSL